MLQIFATYVDFLKRSDQSVNGCTQEFYDEHGETLLDCTGCWNCLDCTCCDHCVDCVNRTDFHYTKEVLLTDFGKTFSQFYTV